MQQQTWLSAIDSPEDLKRVPEEALPGLCAELRDFLIFHVSQTGGHLASNLGAVELSVGIHRVFDCPQDDIVFDVGHQSYVHKILTGRKSRFDTLRQFGGISGYPRPWESKYDAAVAGHASSSVSVALGMARAKKAAGKDSFTVCVIGDGAFTGGMAYEAMNDAGQSGLPLIVVFNDNDMSISPNVGALAKRLSAIRIKPHYFRLKERTKAALSHVPGGKSLIRGISACKKHIRTAILKETLFELMGFQYLGPADGNDISAVLCLLEQAKKLRRPVVVHLKTVKGKGYLPSQKEPTMFHGISAFDRVTGEPVSRHAKDFSAVFGEELSRLASQNEKVCAVTPAMSSGTGLSGFAKEYPDRFFDVGIAEGHAVGMASGLAARGMLPVCAIYSTFLQRGYDQLIHDVAINGNHVVLAVDRAGLVGADGETHQGMFDVAYLRSIPGMRIFSPTSYAEMRSALELAVFQVKGPAAVRYPRGCEGRFTENTFAEEMALIREGSDAVLCAYGCMVNEALDAADLLAQEGRQVSVLKINELTYTDPAPLLAAARKTGRVLVLEDCVNEGCLGQRIAEQLLEHGVQAKLRLCNIGAQFVPHGKVSELHSALHLDGNGAAQTLRELLHE